MYLCFLRKISLLLLYCWISALYLDVAFPYIWETWLCVLYQLYISKDFASQNSQRAYDKIMQSQFCNYLDLCRNLEKILVCRKHYCEIQPSSHVNFAVVFDFCGRDWSCGRLLTFSSEWEISDLFFAYAYISFYLADGNVNCIQPLENNTFIKWNAYGSEAMDCERRLMYYFYLKVHFNLVKTC